MSETPKSNCPDCSDLDRRGFLRTAALMTAATATAATVRAEDKTTEPKPVAKAKPAEELIKELVSTLTDDQKKQVILPWDHGAGEGKIATRHGMYNAPVMKKVIGKEYTKPQQELLERIVKSMCSDDEGYKKISRNGRWDGSGSFDGCGALIFGDVAEGKKYAFLFTGHHLTMRVDGNSEEGAAFGGPMYYGHSAGGYSDRNVFNFQTKSVLSVWENLNEQQRKKALMTMNPGEGPKSIQFRKDQYPGVPYEDLTKDQRKHVEQVMRDILAPYRKEDADEVMEIVKKNGGMEKIHIGFFEDKAMKDNERWHFWRLEGPGFVWNYRVLDHVHTFVNISSKV